MKLTKMIIAPLLMLSLNSFSQVVSNPSGTGSEIPTSAPVGINAIRVAAQRFVGADVGLMNSLKDSGPGVYYAQLHFRIVSDVDYSKQNGNSTNGKYPGGRSTGLNVLPVTFYVNSNKEVFIEASGIEFKNMNSQEANNLSSGSYNWDIKGEQGFFKVVDNITVGKIRVDETDYNGAADISNGIEYGLFSMEAALGLNGSGDKKARIEGRVRPELGAYSIKKLDQNNILIDVADVDLAKDGSFNGWYSKLETSLGFIYQNKGFRFSLTGSVKFNWTVNKDYASRQLMDQYFLDHSIWTAEKIGADQTFQVATQEYIDLKTAWANSIGIDPLTASDSTFLDNNPGVVKPVYSFKAKEPAAPGPGETIWNTTKYIARVDISKIFTKGKYPQALGVFAQYDYTTQKLEGNLTGFTSGTLGTVGIYYKF